MSTLTDVKKRIRALLISSKSGCTLKTLYQDHLSVIGEELPYKRLGYRTLVAFVKTIPDVVSLKVRDGETLLYAVPDETTQHISRMVSRQRSSRSAAYVQPPPRKKQPQKRIPEAFGIQLKQLFLSYPNGIALERFNEAFGRRYGYYVKFTPWGYSTLEELLEDAEGTELVHDPLKGSCIVKPQRKGSKLTLQLDQNVPPSDSLHALETSPVEKKSIGKCLKKDAATSSEARETEKEKKEKTSSKPVIPDVLVRNIKELLKANSAGVWLSQFCALYKDFFGEELPFFTHGYSTPLHLLSSLPDCCVILRPQVGNGDWLVTAVGSIVKVAPNHGYSSIAYLSSKLSTIIHQMLAPAAPEGIPIRSFLAAYKEYTGKDLDMKELGFNTLVELLERVNGVRVMKPPGTELMMVCGPNKKKRGKKEGSGSELTSSSDVSSENESQVAPRPPGSMASGYKKQAVPIEKKMAGVYVTHVHTPSCVCVQLIGENTTRALEYLLEDITQFYNSPKGDPYQLNKPHIGQPCCALFNNDGYWYRAEVVSVSTSDITEVLYVDYGNTGKVPTASLRKTKPHYMILPAQAVKCRLAHLKPAGSRWSMQASSLLFQMTKDKPIVAILSAVVDDLISASLCDTTSEEDIHINDTIVSQGLAIYMKDTEQEEKKYDGYLPELTPQGAADTPTVRAPNDSKPSQPSINTPSPNLSHTSTDNSLHTTPTSINPSPYIPTSINPLPSIPPTPPAMPAPPGFSAPPTSQDPAHFMKNYLLNLFVQQAYLTGLTGTTPSAINQLLTGQSGLAPGLFPSGIGTMTPELSSSNVLPHQTCPTSMPQSHQTCPTSMPQYHQTCPTSMPRPHQTCPTSMPQSHQTCPTSITHSTPITEPVNTDSHLQEKTQPSPIHTPTTGTSTSTTTVTREDKECKQSSPSSNVIMIKKCQLTPQHCLHVVRHSNRAYVLSPQVSKWFWDTDLLQSMLRQVHNSRQVWGLLLQSHRASDLFREMKKDSILRALLRGRNEVTVYALEDLPSIVTMFHGMAALCSAVKVQCDEWLQRGLDYFTDTDRELERIITSLEELKTRRSQILASLSEDGEEDNVDKGALELVKVTKSISKLKASWTALVSQEGNDDIHTQRSDHRDRGLTRDPRPPSSHVVHDRSVSCSQTSDYDDTCASTVSVLTPEPTSPVAMKSSEIFPATYTEANPVLPSPFNSSSSSSLSSLSDLPVFIPPLTSKKDSVEEEASEKALHFSVSCNSTLTRGDSPENHQKSVTTTLDCIRTADENRMESDTSSVVRNHSLPWVEEKCNESEVHSPVKDNTTEGVASNTQSAGSTSTVSKWSLGEQLRSLGKAPVGQHSSTFRLKESGSIYTCKKRSSSSYSDHSPSTGQSHSEVGWKPKTGAEDGVARSGQASSPGNSGQANSSWSRRYSSPRRRRGRFRPASQGSTQSPIQFSKWDVSLKDVSSKKPETEHSSNSWTPRYVLRSETVDFSSSSGLSSPSDLPSDFQNFPPSIAHNTCTPTSQTPISHTPVSHTPTSQTPTPSLQDVRETPTGTSSSCSVKPEEHDFSGECWDIVSEKETDLDDQESKKEDSSTKEIWGGVEDIVSEEIDEIIGEECGFEAENEGILVELVNDEVCGGLDSEIGDNTTTETDTLPVVNQLESTVQSQVVCIEGKSEENEGILVELVNDEVCGGLDSEIRDNITDTLPVVDQLESTVQSQVVCIEGKSEENEGVLVELVNDEVCGGLDSEIRDNITDTLPVVNQLESTVQSQVVCIEGKSEENEGLQIDVDTVAVVEMHNVREKVADGDGSEVVRENEQVVCGKEDTNDTSLFSDGVERCNEAGNDNSEIVACGDVELCTTEVAVKEDKDCIVKVNTQDDEGVDDGEVSNVGVMNEEVRVSREAVSLSGLEDWCKQMELKGCPQNLDTVEPEHEGIMEATTRRLQHTSDEPGIALLIDVGGPTENSQSVDVGRIVDRQLIDGTASQSEVMDNSVTLLDHCNQEEGLQFVSSKQLEDGQVGCATDKKDTLISDVEDQHKVITLTTSKPDEGGERGQPTNDSSLVADAETINDGSSTPPLTSPTMAVLGESKVSSQFAPCMSWLSPPPNVSASAPASLRPTRSFRSQMPCKNFDPNTKLLKPAGPSSSAVWPRAPPPIVSQPFLPATSSSSDACSKPHCSSNSPSNSLSCTLPSPLPTTPVSLPPQHDIPQVSPPFYTTDTVSFLPLHPPSNITHPAYPLPFTPHSSPSLCSLVQVEPFVPRQSLYLPPGTVVDWNDRRFIGLGPGNSIDNPRGFMLPGYPEPYCAPHYCIQGGTWHFTTPRPQ